MSFCPDNVGNWSPSPQNESGLYYLTQYGRLVPATAPREKRKASLERSWSKLRRILRRVRPIFQIVVAKAHANVLKGTFSSGCASNCGRIGVTNTIVNKLGKVRHVFLRDGIDGNNGTGRDGLTVVKMEPWSSPVDNFTYRRLLPSRPA